MFGARIKQEARAGLNHRTEPQALEPVREHLRPSLPALLERIEMVVIECQRDAVVSSIGNKGDGILEPMVGGPVRVVREA